MNSTQTTLYKGGSIKFTCDRDRFVCSPRSKLHISNFGEGRILHNKITDSFFAIPQWTCLTQSNIQVGDHHKKQQQHSTEET